MKRIIPLLVLTVLAGCAAIRPGAPQPTMIATADGGGMPVWDAEHFRLHYGLRFGAAFSSWQFVNCAPNTPCTANGPINSHTGDPAYYAFYKFNTDITQLSQMFGTSSHLATSGTVNYSDIVGLWTGCSSGTPVLSYTGSCTSGGSSGSVTDGSGTTTANELLLSSTTAHAYTNAATLPTSALPALAGDVTSTAGSNSVTVSKVSGVSGTPTTVTFYNNTSGTGVLEAPAGVALGTLTWTLPDATGTLLYSGGPAGTPSSINLSGATSLTLPVGAINATGTASSTTFLEGDGKWATPTAAASSITPGTTTVSGATAPCLIDNSTGTTMGCASVGAGLTLSSGVLNTAPAPNRTAASPTVASTDMGGQINVSSGTITIPAISSTVFAPGQTLVLVNTSASTETVTSTPTVNTGANCVQATGIPAGDAWDLISNGTSLDCHQVVSSTTGGSGLTSVGLSTTASWFTVGSSPLTANGTITINPTTGLTANEVLATPNGTTGAVAPRALVGADIPAVNLAGTGNGGVNGTLGVANGGTGATSSVTYLIDNGTAFTLGTGTGACATASVVAAGAANGEVTCTGTTGASTLVVNLPTATHGWTCSASDITQKTALPESAFTTTSATVSGSVTASDDIVIGCTGW